MASCFPRLANAFEVVAEAFDFEEVLQPVFFARSRLEFRVHSGGCRLKAGLRATSLGRFSRQRDHSTSCPCGACPGSRNVFTDSPSPQTVMPGNRPNHSPPGNFGIGIEPGGELHDVRPSDLPFAGAGQEVLEQGVGQPGAANPPGMSAATIKPLGDRFAKLPGLFRIGRSDELIHEGAEFFRRQLGNLCELLRVAHDLGQFRGGQAGSLPDDLGGGHAGRMPD